MPHHLLLCLQSVKKALQNLDAEIVVVDNCSKDASCELVKRYFPKVILFQNERNEGFSKGNNHGIKIAQGEYICLLNPDTLVPESVFEKVLEFAENHLEAGAIGVKMIDGTGNFLPESKRNLPTPKVAFEKLLGKTKNYYANHLDENEIGKIEILPGAFMFIKRSVYWQVGGLDEAYFMYGEDIDLSYKFAKAGFQNYYFGEEVILHFKGESTVKNSEYANRFYGAMRLFHEKHFPSNFVVELLVKYALEVVKFSNQLRFKKKKQVSTKNEKVVWIGMKSSVHSEKFVKKIGSKSLFLSLENIHNQNIEKHLLIFDAEIFSFGKIIDLFQKLKGNGNQFRIKPQVFEFIIGSDSSDDKGEIILMN